MTEGKPIVYRATNLVNGKTYIGFTIKSLHARKIRHVCDARKRKTSVHFHLAILKYGIEAFRFSVLKECDDKAHAKAEERRLIALLNPEYNKTSGGDGAPDYEHTPEVRAKISKGITASYATGRRMMKRIVCLTDGILFESLKAAAAHYGVHPATLCEAVKGRTALCKGRVFSELNGPKAHIDLNMLMEEITRARASQYDQKRRPILCINDGRHYASVTEAASFYGIGRQSVDRVARGERKTAKGMKFLYVETAS